jgi:glycosyltransferase involved in cell wall biosynthesis
VTASRLAAQVRFDGYLDHASTLAAERSADLLLLVANTTPGAEATVPGKLFEYLASGRPVLAVAPRQSATADVLRRTDGGWLAAADDQHAIACQLRAAFEAQRTGRACRADPAELARFDRRRLTRDLARILDAVLAAR